MVILLPQSLAVICYQPLCGHYYSQGRVMKNPLLVLFLLSSSALANPYKSEFLMWHFKYKKEKYISTGLVNPSSPWGAAQNWVDTCNQIGKKFWSWLSKAE